MFEKLTSEDLITEMDNYELELEFAAELELAAEVEENYEHDDYRDDLVEDELDIIDSDISFDDMVDSFNRFDDVRDFDYYES
jgi:hypothetical protein